MNIIATIEELIDDMDGNYYDSVDSNKFTSDFVLEAHSHLMDFADSVLDIADNLDEEMDPREIRGLLEDLIGR